MASKRNQRRKACGDKHRHESQTQAIAHAVHLRKRGDGQLHAYHCPHCHHWHVGHLTKKARQAARAKGKQ